MDDNQPGVTSEVAEETSAEQTPTAESQGRETGQESSTSQQGQAGEEGTQLTDRGTKVAKEPESQFYQQLKNENADMRALLGDPGALKEYLRQSEGTQAPKEGEADDLSDAAEKVLNPDGTLNLAKLVSYMEERSAKKIEQGIKFHTDNRLRSYEIGKTYDSDKAGVRSQHPELDPKSDRFDPELDQFIGERFLAQGGLEGKVSLTKVVDQSFAFLEKVKGTGRQAAETEIVRKSAGAITKPSVQGQPRDAGEEELSPAQILASRVRKTVTPKRS